jgi:ascorbate-specific PTS system EIIC-type component UlaA
MMRGKIVVFIQFVFIVLLVYALSAEYQSNQYQQTWVLENVPWLQYFLNGYMAAALIGILLGGVFLLVSDIMRNRGRRGGLKTVV